MHYCKNSDQHADNFGFSFKVLIFHNFAFTYVLVNGKWLRPRIQEDFSALLPTLNRNSLSAVRITKLLSSSGVSKGEVDRTSRIAGAKQPHNGLLGDHSYIT